VRRKINNQAAMDAGWLWIEQMRGEGWTHKAILKATGLHHRVLRSFVWHQNRGLRRLWPHPYSRRKENMDALVDRSIMEECRIPSIMEEYYSGA